MSMREGERVDWFRVLTELKRHGIAHSGIRGAIGIPESTLQGYKTGSEPKHVDGERLIEFWCQVTGRTRAELPMEKITLSVAMVK